jgi:methyltransferase (TIGR00027 family)
MQKFSLSLKQFALQEYNFPMAILNDVSDTALWVAVYRAQESERPDALFKDPLAKVLAGERGLDIAFRMPAAQYTRWSVVIRTQMIDTYIENLIAKGVDTVINLGAGLDTRPYRMKLPATLKWLEVDFPHMIKLKNDKLAKVKPVCHLERVSVDLANDKARAEFLTRANGQAKKALIITEGVVPYLTNAQVAALAKDLRRCSNFKYWIVDYYVPEVMRFMRSKKRMREMQNAPFQFQPGDWYAFFKSHGWTNYETKFLGEESERVGRPSPMPLIGKIAMLFMPAAKKLYFKRFYGYAVLEPN